MTAATTGVAVSLAVVFGAIGKGAVRRERKWEGEAIWKGCFCGDGRDVVM